MNKFHYDQYLATDPPVRGSAPFVLSSDGTDRQEVEFDVTVLTFRSGSHTVRVAAANPATARSLVQADLDSGACHCPAEWCTDDVDSTLLDVKQVVLDDDAHGVHHP
jgi:hypothetical protein